MSIQRTPWTARTPALTDQSPGCTHQLVRLSLSRSDKTQTRPHRSPDRTESSLNARNSVRVPTSPVWHAYIIYTCTLSYFIIANNLFILKCVLSAWSVVSSYGMEAGPPRFLYLKDEYFLMTDWCDLDISLIMKNSKSVTLISRSVRMEQRKMLDQYLTWGVVSTRSIQRFKRYPILKTFNQNFQRKISKSVTLTSRLVRGWGWCSIQC